MILAINETIEAMQTLLSRLDLAILANNQPTMQEITKNLISLSTALKKRARNHRSLPIITAAEDLEKMLFMLQNSRIPKTQETAFTNIANIMNHIRQLIREPALVPTSSQLLLNFLGITLAAHSFSVDAGEPRVAAIMYSADEQFAIASNDALGSLPLKHAEENAILNLLGRNEPIENATLFVSAIPCLDTYTLEFNGAPANAKVQFQSTTVGTMTGSNQSRPKGPGQITWVKQGDTTFHCPEFGVLLYEHRFENDPSQAIVHYQFTHPRFGTHYVLREYRQYFVENGVLKARVWDGCAVMLAFLRVKRVYYLFDEPQYSLSHKYMESQGGVQVMKVDNHDFVEIAKLAKINPAHPSMASHVARLSAKLRLDVHFIEEIFGIRLA